jgi:DNA repair exonuclease SbcCD nuclease subunit
MSAPRVQVRAGRYSGDVRILFLSDTHLGVDLPARPRVERPRRGEDFFRAYAQALAPALAGDVDAVVHGGDLLYRSRVPASLAEAALAPLRAVAARGTPVLLVPGNHERSEVPYPLLSLHEHLHVFHAPRTVHLEARGLRVAFSGFPYARDVRARFRTLLEATRHQERTADVRVLCLHQCVEGATCGPAGFTFRDGADVIRRADLPSDVAAVLCGHVHRHQVLRGPPGPAVVYAGSTERTSFAEAGEPKGTVVVELAARGLAGVEFRPLRARPMVIRRLSLAGLDAAAARARIAREVAATPPDAVVRLRVDGPLADGLAPVLGARALRAVAGERDVSVGGAAFGRGGATPRARPSPASAPAAPAAGTPSGTHGR